MSSLQMQFPSLPKVCSGYFVTYTFPGIPTTIKIMGVNITTIDYLRVLIIEIVSTNILMVVEAQGIDIIDSF